MATFKFHVNKTNGKSPRDILAHDKDEAVELYWRIYPQRLIKPVHVFKSASAVTLKDHKAFWAKQLTSWMVLGRVGQVVKLSGGDMFFSPIPEWPRASPSPQNLLHAKLDAQNPGAPYPSSLMEHMGALKASLKVLEHADTPGKIDHAMDVIKAAMNGVKTSSDQSTAAVKDFVLSVEEAKKQLNLPSSVTTDLPKMYPGLAGMPFQHQHNHPSKFVWKHSDEPLPGGVWGKMPGDEKYLSLEDAHDKQFVQKTYQLNTDDGPIYVSEAQAAPLIAQKAAWVVKAGYKLTTLQPLKGKTIKLVNGELVVESVIVGNDSYGEVLLPPPPQKATLPTDFVPMFPAIHTKWVDDKTVQVDCLGHLTTLTGWTKQVIEVTSSMRLIVECYGGKMNMSGVVDLGAWTHSYTMQTIHTDPMGWKSWGPLLLQVISTENLKNGSAMDLPSVPVVKTLTKSNDLVNVFVGAPMMGGDAPELNKIWNSTSTVPKHQTIKIHLSEKMSLEVANLGKAGIEMCLLVLDAQGKQNLYQMKKAPHLAHDGGAYWSVDKQLK